MLKRPFLIFLGVLAAMIGATIALLHSSRFANLAKTFISRQIPKDIGIEGDFREFRVQLFPPGVAVTQPKIEVRAGNRLGLPAGSKVSAARVELRFYPLQMLSGKIRVNEVSVIQAEVDLNLPEIRSRSGKGGRLELNWRDLVKIRLDALSFEDSNVRLNFAKNGGRVEFNARELVIRQSLEDEPEFELTAAISDLKTDFEKVQNLPSKVDELACDIKVNSKETLIRKLRIVDREEGRPLDIEGTGKIVGDLMRPRSLLLESELRIDGDLRRLALLAGLGGEVSGTTHFNGKVHADLLRFVQTVRSEGFVEFKDVGLNAWKFSAAAAKFTLGAGLGSPGVALKLDSLEISSPELERADGAPASGGRIRGAEFTIPLQQILERTEAVSFVAPLQFHHVHLHWLAAPVIKAIFPLDLRANGSVELGFTRPAGRRSMDLRAKLGLVLPHLQLDNQRLGKRKPLKRVLRVADLRINGDVVVDQQAVRPQSLQLDLLNSKFTVDGKVDFKDGYDLRARGIVDLQELEVLAENKVRGLGDLAVHVHGPASRVLIDFDASLKEAFYLNLHLGDLQGRITWDDDPARLIFRQVQLAQGQSNYIGDGALELGEKNDIALTFQFGSAQAAANISDVLKIFSEMTKDLWWFPRSLLGACRGEVRVSGGLSLDSLIVTSSLTGTNWEWFREKFRATSMNVIYDRGRYSVQNARLQKKHGVIGGDISYSPDQSIRWSVRTEGFQLNDLDNFVRLNVPIRGEVQVVSAGEGKIGKAKSATTLQLTEHFVRGEPVPPSKLEWSTADGILRVGGNLAGRQGLVDAKYDFDPGGPSNLRVVLDRFDVSPFMTMLNSRLVQDPQLQGNLSGAVDLDFRSGDFEHGSGRIDVREALIQKTGAKLELARPVEIQVKGGSFDPRELQFHGTLGDIALRMAARDAYMDGTVLGDLDASILEFFTAEVAKAKGKIELDFGMSGTIKEPAVSGKFGVNSVYVKLNSMEQPLENLTGTLQLRKGVLLVQYLNGDLATGRVSATGTLEFFVDRFPKMDLKATLMDNKLLVYPFQFAKVRGKLHATGTELPYRVDGDVYVEQALSREPVLNKVRERGRRTVHYMPTTGGADESGTSLFSLNIRARADRGILVKNDLFDAELKGDLNIINTISAPRILGWAEVISGRINFKEQGFAIQSGRLDFDNPSAINPKFNLAATTEVNATRIRLYAVGTPSSMKVDLTSDPALSEPQILSLLALGFTNEEVNRMKPADRGAIQQSEAASLLLYSLDFNREVQEKTGIRIQVEEALDTQSGTSIFRPQAGTETVASPKIVIKRNIGKRVDLSVGSTVGVGTNTQREVNAEVKVTPGMSVIGVWNAYEGVTAQDQFTSYGVDLKLQKRFK